jgi:diguanylate cyclase (GGDEF)-like protein
MPVVVTYRDEIEDMSALSKPPLLDRPATPDFPPEAKADVLIHWAHAVAIAANRRIAELETRLAYLESQATTDELTRLYNRRGFLRAFSRANAAARRGGQGGVVIVLDLDGFKKVNDMLGHAHGDKTLRHVGALLRRKTRRMDATARFGGDEFAMLLIGASVITAKRKCLSILRALGALGLSASFGIAAFDGRDEESTVLHRADMAMYEEKRNNTALPAPEPQD